MKIIHTRKFIVASLTIALIAINAQAAIAADNCANLLATKCADCHNLNRVCQKLGKKNESRWAKTIKRMIKRGTKLTKEESAEITACLANESPGAVQACK